MAVKATNDFESDMARRFGSSGADSAADEVSFAVLTRASEPVQRLQQQDAPMSWNTVQLYTSFVIADQLIHIMLPPINRIASLPLLHDREMQIGFSGNTHYFLFALKGSEDGAGQPLMWAWCA